jgi:hypothetical protein
VLQSAVIVDQKGSWACADCCASPQVFIVECLTAAHRGSSCTGASTDPASFSANEHPETLTFASRTSMKCSVLMLLQVIVSRRVTEQIDPDSVSQPPAQAIGKHLNLSAERCGWSLSMR